MNRWMTLGLALLFTGCGPNVARFDAGPVVTQVGPLHDINEPSETEFYRFAHHIENFGIRQARLGLDPVSPKPALDVNRMGEVPSSSWYVQRGDLTPEQVHDGHGGDDPGPEAYFPWTISRAKVGGANPGFNFSDARGVNYLLKVDKIGEPFVATAAGAISNRLFWALGYHVPDDRVVEFRTSDLLLGDKAIARGVTQEQVDEVLENFATSLGDGRYRALVSRFLPGKPIGGFDYTGTRADDPNDVIAHERRRSLRGLRVFGAWLNHVDMKIDNTLDLYTERDGRRFVEHYLVDFDGCLGGYWAARHELRIGWARDADLGEIVTGLSSLGLSTRPYETLGDPIHPKIGLFEAEVYDPANFRANYSNDYVQSARPSDLYWAGTVLARLERAHVDAAVTAGRFADESANHLLSDVLWKRWEKTVDWALMQATPVVDLAINETNDLLRVDAQDLLAQIGRPKDLHYRIQLLNADGHVAKILVEGSDSPSVTVPATDVDDYFVLRWVATDARGKRLRPSEAHYLRTAEGWHLAGILRDGE